MLALRGAVTLEGLDIAVLREAQRVPEADRLLYAPLALEGARQGDGLRRRREEEGGRRRRRGQGEEDGVRGLRREHGRAAARARGRAVLVRALHQAEPRDDAARARPRDVPACMGLQKLARSRPPQGPADPRSSD